MEKSTFREATGLSSSQEISVFYEIRRIIITFTSERQLSLSRNSLIQSISPNPTS